MADRASLHRYELLLPERRDGQRRAGDRRLGHDDEDGRRSGDRRGDGTLLDVEDVRRVFPVEEGAPPRRVRRRDRATRAGLVAADALAVLLSLLAAESAFGETPTPGGLAASVVLAVALAQLVRLYDNDDLVLRRSTLDEVPRLLQVAGLATLLHFIVFHPSTERGLLLVAWACLAGGLVLARALARTLTRRALPPERCLLVGDAEVIDYVGRKLADCRANAEAVAAVRLHPGQSAADLGGLEGLQTLVAGDRIERVVIAPTTTDATSTLELVRLCKLVGVSVSILPRLLEVVGSSVEFDDVDGMTLLGVRRFGLSRPARVLKRGFDLVVTSALLLAAAPLMALLAVAVRLDSPGPVLFRQQRVGRDGHHFEILKFRTMVADAEALKEQLRARNEAGDGLFKIADDPRITGVGRLLRSTSLDELPQLLNVLRGEMSLVGPRPLVIDEDAQVLGLDRQRLHLTPGMTGPWQVLAGARVPLEEMVGMDYVYVASWSLWGDLKLLLRTIGHVLHRGNA